MLLRSIEICMLATPTVQRKCLLALRLLLHSTNYPFMYQVILVIRI